jgi:hypothetical protein
MKVTRKGFISSVATAVAATVAAPSSQAFAGLLSPSISADVNTFSNHVGSAFEFAGPEGARASLVLKDLVKHPSGSRVEQFSLLFANSDNGRLPEGNYRVRHKTIGSMNLFLVPGGKKAALRADFSLLKA